MKIYHIHDWSEVIGQAVVYGSLIGLPVALVVCFFVTNSWTPFFPVWILTMIALGLLSFGIQQNESAQDERKKEREDHDRYYEHRRYLKNQADEAAKLAKGAIEPLPTRIANAEFALDLAETEFNEGAFSPFWDAVEKAVTNLAKFHEDSTAIVENSKKCSECMEELYRYSPEDRPVFPVSIDNLPDPRSTFMRLSTIVRRAQKNFQFATIYEQRKTNKILVHGFGGLGEAIEVMGERIASRLEDLSATISVSFAEQNALITDEFGKLNETLATESEERRKHETQELEMLDNIQSRRRPDRLVPDPRDGDWEKK